MLRTLLSVSVSVPLSDIWMWSAGGWGVWKSEAVTGPPRELVAWRRGDDPWGAGCLDSHFTIARPSFPLSGNLR